MDPKRGKKMAMETADWHELLSQAKYKMKKWEKDLPIKARDNPGSPQPLVDLAALYTLLGDYLNALKYLNRAAALRPAGGCGAVAGGSRARRAVTVRSNSTTIASGAAATP